MSLYSNPHLPPPIKHCHVSYEENEFTTEPGILRAHLCAVHVCLLNSFSVLILHLFITLA